MTPHERSVFWYPSRVQLIRDLEELIGRTACEQARAIEWEKLRGLLEALPLTTGEFATAVNRLTNARHYYDTGEYGAGSFELRQLLLSLSSEERL
jgi:hypothetical protein